MIVVVEWHFDKGGSTNGDGITLPHDTYFAFIDDELVGYIERPEGTILECTDWVLHWYCKDGITSCGMPLGEQHDFNGARARWLEVFREALEDQ